MASDSHITGRVKDMARAAGFAAVGVAAAGPAAGEEAFRAWLDAGNHAGLDYLQRDVSLRFRPSELVGGARSVLCLAVSYAPSDDGAASSQFPFVARYARGRDYHKVLKKRCHRLMDDLRQAWPEFDGRAFVDSAPLAERSLAAAAGLGWIGRSGCLIVPEVGSYVVLCEIVSNLQIEADAPLASGCGGCDACLRACPGGACLGDGRVDARRCLSYLSIEHHGDVPEQMRAAWGQCLFGCDSCQQACPHNLGIPAGDAELALPRGLAGTALADVLRWSWDDWDRATRGSATRRAGYGMILRNAVLAAASTADGSLRPPLLELRAQRPELGELIDRTLDRLDRT